jgi:hypothetical protein
MSEPLPAIPVVDIRDGGPPRHAQESAARARALRDGCLAFFPKAALPLVPAMDWTARRWLARSHSPYVPEIARIAALLDFSGVWLLNASYQWGCTALACERDDVPWLARTLDWPFTGLGRHVEIARMRADHGEFFSVTWPGYVGALTAMAPGRFAACVNQAPLWRRATSRWLRPYDVAANALAILANVRFMPPDQLLRRTFELCGDYGAARRMLETTPVARPVIYTLIGCEGDQRCVIERIETDFVTREQDTCAANDWVPPRPGWEGRIGTRRFLTSSFADAASYSRGRREALAAWPGDFAESGLNWVREPVLNPYTRLAIAMCPGRGIIRARGYDLAGGGACVNLPEPVTQLCELETLTPRHAA